MRAGSLIFLPLRPRAQTLSGSLTRSSLTTSIIYGGRCPNRHKNECCDTHMTLRGAQAAAGGAQSTANPIGAHLLLTRRVDDHPCDAAPAGQALGPNRRWVDCTKVARRTRADCAAAVEPASSTRLGVQIARRGVEFSSRHRRDARRRESSTPHEQRWISSSRFRSVAAVRCGPGVKIYEKVYAIAGHLRGV